MRHRKIISFIRLIILLNLLSTSTNSLGGSRLDNEIEIRQTLIQVALGREPADLVLSGSTILNVFTSEWQSDQEIVIVNGRIGWVGPSGIWKGKTRKRINVKGLWAVPGFGESHKHIESSYLTPEYEAALVIPRGNTWTIEGSHELSNVVGEHNVSFWVAAEDAGSPLKIFPAIGSATPPTVYERAGGYYGYNEMRDFLRQDLRVAALGEVMDWPALSNRGAPGNDRIWGMIKATWEGRGIVEGHGSGLRSVNEINAFAAAGLSSDHEVRMAAEGLEKLRRGVFLEVRADAARVLFPYLVKSGITDWSNISVTTDDRDVAATLTLGAMDYNIRNAIRSGVPIIEAYKMGSYNTARRFKLDHLVGSLGPGRHADIVFLSDPKSVEIHSVYANGQLASHIDNKEGEYLLPIANVDYPHWARSTMNVGRKVNAEDFVIKAPEDTEKVNVALLKPFYFEDNFIKSEMIVTEGKVKSDPSNGISKVAIVDRYHGNASTSKMFWTGVGPITPGSALASSQMHDIHNIWVLGNDDEAMALAANTVAELEGGWALVKEGKIVATVTLDIAGLMTARPVETVAAEVEALFAAADKIEWIGGGGLPERMRFAFLTASPWRWQLVAPYPGNPSGFVNVTNGETHPVIW